MKKILCLFLALIFSFAFMSCSPENPAPATSDNASTSMEESTKERITIPITTVEEKTEEESEEEVSVTEETSTKSSSSSQKNNSEATTKKTAKENNDNNDSNYSGTVYRTPTGKRYHYLSTCGGKNSYKTTLSSAKAAGLTPCQKCAH